MDLIAAYSLAKPKDYIICFCLSLLSFITFFYGNEWIAINKDKVYIFAFQWEINTPYLRYFFFVYYGIFILPMLVPFFVKRRKDLVILTKQIIFANLISGIFFFFFTTQSIYPPPSQKNLFWDFTIAITGKYNLFPSLHVTLSLLLIKVFIYYSKKNIKIILTILAILLILSTLFTHQHHLLDIIGSIILYKIVTITFSYEFQHKL